MTTNRPRKTHVIVGAGTSGCILASSLLNHDDVILITNGPGLNSSNNYFDREEFQNPLQWSSAAFFSDKCPLAYVNKSQSRRVIKYGQGIGVGGCSNVNAMLWAWGSDLVFDKHWPSEWNSQAMKK